MSNRNAVINLIVPDDEPVGSITKLIPKEYIPKYDWETNSSDLLNSKVYSHDGEEPIIIYNGSNLLLLFDRVK